MNVVSPAPMSGPFAPRLSPDSPLVHAARDLVVRHGATAPREGHCLSCGRPYPCPSIVHAALVCGAAGLEPEAMGLPAEAATWDLND
jgi:hypothetical protein